MRLNSFFIFFMFALSGVLGFFLSLLMHGQHVESPSMMSERTFHYPTLLVNQLAHDAHAGEKIFKGFCASCHGKEAVIDTHAPRIGDKKTWQSLRKSGVTALLTITLSGRGAMPARGGCFECSDEQLRETIGYMLDKSK